MTVAQEGGLVRKVLASDAFQPQCKRSVVNVTFTVQCRALLWYTELTMDKKPCAPTPVTPAGQHSCLGEGFTPFMT